MTETEEAYKNGLRDGEIQGLHKRLDSHAGRLDIHAGRIRALERISWIVIGGVALVQFGPIIAAFLSKLAG